MKVLEVSSLYEYGALYYAEAKRDVSKDWHNVFNQEGQTIILELPTDDDEEPVEARLRALLFDSVDPKFIRWILNFYQASGSETDHADFWIVESENKNDE